MGGYNPFSHHDSHEIMFTYSKAIDSSPAPKQNAMKNSTAVEKLKKKVDIFRRFPQRIIGALEGTFFQFSK